MSPVRYLKLLGTAVLRGLWYTFDHVMPALRRLDVSIVRVLYQLRRAVQPGIRTGFRAGGITTGKTAQADLGLG